MKTSIGIGSSIRKGSALGLSSRLINNRRSSLNQNTSINNNDNNNNNHIINLAIGNSNEFDFETESDLQNIKTLLKTFVYHKHSNSNGPSIIRSGSKIDNNKNNDNNGNNNNSNIYTLTNTNINITNINNKRILVYALREAERYMKFLTAQLIKEKLVEFQ